MDELEEVRFYCDDCGHHFCLELDDDMPIPKYCIFCAALIYFKEDENTNDLGFHL
tara:strand:+ start:79 stop:243 length:165 start_codon:yes stop_codon:yes gene_type:complete